MTKTVGTSGCVPHAIETVRRLEQAVRLLEACPEFTLLMPEVRVNFVYAAENATEPEQVAGVDGRITVVGGMPKASGPVRFGVSDHMARLVIEARKYEPTIRAGLNFRWNEAIFEFVRSYADANGVPVGTVDRKSEPGELLGRDRSSIPWKVRHLIERHGTIPRLCYESRGWGKEPLFFILGPGPDWVATLAITLARGFAAEQASRPAT